MDEVSTSPSYELIFTMQFIMSCNYIMVLVSCDTVVPLLIILGCGYFKVVHDRLIHFYEMDDPLESLDFDDFYEELIVCSKLHQYTFK